MPSERPSHSYLIPPTRIHVMFRTLNHVGFGDQSNSSGGWTVWTDWWLGSAVRIQSLHPNVQSLHPNVESAEKKKKIKSLLLSHDHSTCALVRNSWERAPDRNNLHMDSTYRLYRRQCAEYTYIYSVRSHLHGYIIRNPTTNTFDPYLLYFKSASTWITVILDLKEFNTTFLSFKRLVICCKEKH